MNIFKILPLLANICIYYYKTYHKIIFNENINVPDIVYHALIDKIYKEYINIRKNNILYDISIMEFPYDKQYILNQDFDEQLFKDMMISDIDRFFDDHSNYYNPPIPINVISISDHPLENYVCFNHDWIKQIIDVYRY